MSEESDEPEAKGICADCVFRQTCEFLLAKVLPFGTTVSWCVDYKTDRPVATRSDSE